MELLPLLSALRKNWYFLIIIPIITGIAAFFLVRELPDQYRSVVQLSTGITLSQGVNLEERRQTYLEINIRFSNLIQNIVSTQVLSQLSYELILHDLKEQHKYNPKATLLWEENEFDISQQKAINIFEKCRREFRVLNSNDEEERICRDILLQYEYDAHSLRENLLVHRLRDTDYINIVALADDPEMSAFIVNRLSDIFIGFQNQSSTSNSIESIQFYEQLIKQKKTELDSKNDLLSSYRKRYNLLDLEAESQSKINIIQQLEQEKTEETRKLRALNAELALVKKRIRELTSAGVPRNNNSEVLAVKKNINRLNSLYIASGQSEKKILDSLNYYRERYKILTQIQRNTTSQDSQLEINNLIERRDKLNLDIGVAESNLSEIKQSISSGKVNASNFAFKESKLKELTDDRDLLAEEYKELQVKLSQAKNSYVAGGDAIKIVMRGQIPDQPEKSKKIIYVIIACGASFILVAFFIILREILDFTLKNPTRFKIRVGMNLLGLLTNYDKRKDAGKGVKAGIFKEYLRKIRFELEKSDKKIYLVVSARPGHGKSFFIEAVSNSLSSINKRVLIIDTNFKNNFLTKKYSNSKENLAIKGEIIQKIGSLNELLRKTKTPNVYFLGCVETSDSPFEVFDKNKMKSLLAEIANNFDYIFLEGGSLNLYSDSKELEQISEAVVSVISSESSIGPLDQETFRYFKSLKDKFEGFILNKVDESSLNDI